MKQEVNYGNWVPRNFLFLFILVFLCLLIPTVFPINLFAKIILWVISCIWIFPSVFIFSLYYYFSANNNEIQHSIWNIVIRKLPWNGKGKALDVGTGAGILAIELAKRYPDSNVYGIDYWGRTWNYSKQQCEENAKIEGVADQLTFQKASASNLPFKDEEFDAIVSNFVYHEVRDTRNKMDLIFESLRVLKKGGCFSLQDTFKNKRRYGKFENLINQFKDWGVEQIEYFDTINELSVPKVVRSELKTMCLLYGVK